MHLQYADFPGGVWDGTAPYYADRNVDKNPDFFMADRLTEEIQAIEQWVVDRMGVWSVLQPWGPAGSLLTVKDDDSGLTWRTIEAGSGIDVTYTDDAITISATGNGSVTYLDTPVTNVLYVDNKRTDSYTASGNITRPFKTIQAAINVVAGSSETNRYEIKIAPGADYTEALNINKDRVVFSSEGACLTGAITIDSTHVKFSRLDNQGNVTCNMDNHFIIEVDHCSTSDGTWDITATDSDDAEYLYIYGGVFGSDLNVTGLEAVSWLEPGTIQQGTFIFNGCDSLRIIGSTLLSCEFELNDGTVATISNCSSDGAVLCSLDPTSSLFGDASVAGCMTVLAGTGTYTNTTTASHIRNNSQKVGATVKDALDSIGENMEFIDGIAGVNIKAGQPVYVSAIDGLMYLASAATAAASKVCGFCKTDAATGNSILLIPNGGLTISDWTLIVGSVSLVPGTTYFLSGTAGAITSIPPVSGYVVAVGCALAGDTFNIEIKTPVRL